MCGSPVLGSVLAKRSENKKSKQPFHVALSFASPDRRFAKKLASLLKSIGLGVFFDSDYLAELAGENAKVLEEIYSEKSEIVVPIISKHYLESDWTRFEFDAALKGEKSGNTKIVPVRLDDSQFVGLRSDKFFIDPQDHSLKTIADAIAAKCGVQATNKSKPLKPRTGKKETPSLLSSEARLAFGLIAYSRMPFSCW